MLLAQKPWVAPIPGTTKIHRLEENVGGTEIKLDQHELSNIETLPKDIEVVGARYPHHLQAMVGK